ncbi:hypothetical protein [Rhizobium johnstonii]|uniref:hypothetical protein n=1 Tax=Rhizobium johnstonii TaxID=3019933 RepID=UPI003F9BB0C8
MADIVDKADAWDAAQASWKKGYERGKSEAQDRRIAETRAAAFEEAAKTVLAYSPYDYGDSPAAKYFYEVRVKDAVNEIAAAIRALIPEREG